MANRRFILTTSQINELLNGSYIDKEAETLSSDGTTITASSPKEKPNGNDEYYPAKKMDDFSKTRANSLGRLSPFFGSGVSRQPIGLIEQKLYEIINKAVIGVLNEINSDIYNKTYQITPTGQDNMTGLAKDSVGSNALKNGISGKNLPVYYHRFQQAKKKAENGDPSTLNNMGGMATADEVERMYRQAKNMSKTLRDTKPDGKKVKPNGKGERQDNNENNNGIITYFQ